MRLDPIKTTEKIKQDYVRYLKTTFPITNSNIAMQFEELLREENRLFNGPILEATPPFRTSLSISDLIEDGMLSKRFYDLCGDELPLERSLYEHQELAVRKVVAENRNIVVASGTGSGKTEAFLIPIFNNLLTELENGELSPGVRALLLYPMNALANDQMKRLRRILENFHDITFGRYTGETKEFIKEAKEHFRKNFPKEPRIENELLSREEMRDKPPHILLTNYAMLEYLLLRPKDHEFFDGEKAMHWRFIVIDEAHTYDGAKGIEMSMLIRRLKDRIVKSEPNRIKCIATSATLGSGKKDFPRVARFARQLFGEAIKWEDNNPQKRDVIEASRIQATELSSVQNRPNPMLYQSLIGELNSPQSTFDRLYHTSKQNGIATIDLDKAKSIVKSGHSEESISNFLFEILKGDINLHKLRECLHKRPRFLPDVSSSVFPQLSHKQAQSALSALVDLAVQAKPAKGSTPLLPARYHLFVRALEGAYLQLSPTLILYLDRRETIQVEGKTFVVFEMASCRRCGNLYLVGVNSDGKLKQTREIFEDNRENTEFYLLMTPNVNLVTEDEDEVVIAGSKEFESNAQYYELCTQCGAIDKEGLLTPLCSCPGEKQRIQKVVSKDGQIKHCPACGSRTPIGNLVWRFLTGQDAPVTVLATSLYQQIPIRKVELPKPKEPVKDDWSSTVISKSTVVLDPEAVRQLLLFSDSRQDSAFFACYLERTYHQILRRRLIVQTLEKHKEDILENQWCIQDLVEPLRREAKHLEVFPARWSLQRKKNEVWKWILVELLAFDRRNSLEGLGLLGFGVVKPESWTAPFPLLEEPWKLKADEIWSLYQILLDSFRNKGAIAFPDAISPMDEAFKPRNFEFYFRERDSVTKKHIFAWGNPSKGILNSRLDFLLKLSKMCSSDIAKDDCKKMLVDIWRRGLRVENDNSIWSDYFRGKEIPLEGYAYRFRHEYWKLQAGVIDPDIQWYQCDTCKNLYLHNIRGICPTYQCNGKLLSCDPNDVLSGNHYRGLYLGLKPIRMVSKEHTAQLTSEAAAELQDRFINGKVNVLSCSTTFELGVDVGELETVLMRNVPPSPANYIQRAGRAGRRTDSTAFALTFCQRRSHDLTHFNEPERMVSGKIRSPYFELSNEKIMRRHIHAVALAEFWKQRRDLYGKTQTFFFPAHDSAPEAFKEFLDHHPQALRNRLMRIVPQNLQPVFDFENWSWVEDLLGQDGSITKASDGIRSDIAELERVHKELSEKQERSDHIIRIMHTIKERSIIGYLSTRNVLPKYGFPVDVVSLDIMHHGENAKRLELQRDLTIAISEYAPESEVVAGGRLWVSYGLKKPPKKRGWINYRYAICPNCKRYQRDLQEKEPKLEICCACGIALDGRGVKGNFLFPEFGFITGMKAPRQPGENRPRKTYITRIHFTGDSEKGKSYNWVFDKVKFAATSCRDGEMAVLNRWGFKVCYLCGYAIRQETKTPSSHDSPWGRKCTGKLSRPMGLGHEFRTDILSLRIRGYSLDEESFRLSLLYALLEGLSESLEIRRDDIDGCIFRDSQGYAFILFDNVPGGAGHVKRLTEQEYNLELMLKSALRKVSQCRCDKETSCYSCLCNYHNQFCHNKLSRGKVKKFLESLSL